MRHAILKLQNQMQAAARAAAGEPVEPEEKPERTQNIPSHRKRLDGKKERRYQRWTEEEVTPKHSIDTPNIFSLFSLRASVQEQRRWAAYPSCLRPHVVTCQGPRACCRCWPSRLE